jgi:hypothetical protein
VSSDTGQPIGHYFGAISATTSSVSAMSNRNLSSFAGVDFVVTSTSAINTDHIIGFDFYVTSVTGDNVTVFFGSEVNGQTSTLMAGSTLIRTVS